MEEIAIKDVFVEELKGRRIIGNEYVGVVPFKEGTEPHNKMCKWREKGIFTGNAKIRILTAGNKILKGQIWLEIDWKKTGKGYCEAENLKERATLVP